MIDDPAHPLVQALEGTTASRVYLPPRPMAPGGSNMQSEKLAGRMDVQAIAADYFGSSEALYGDKVPSITIMSEKPIHRMMVYLHGQGASIADIAQHTGFTKSFVGQVLKQPWARQRLVQILNETGRDAVKHFLTHEIAPSLEVLREIRDDGSQKGATRAMAADKILDRALGKPTVSIESNNTNKQVPADIQRIEADLKSVREQLASRGVPDGTN